MSNRLAFVVLMFLTIVIIGVLAFSQGLVPVLIGDTADQKITSLFVPLTGILGTVVGFLMVLDARVAEGKISEVNLLDLITLPEFYPAWLSVGVGAANIFGVQVISQDTQSLVVSVFTTFTAILLYSFANRAPRDPLTVAQKVQAASAQKVQRRE